MLDKKEEWQLQATFCTVKDNKHDWLPVAWKVSPHSKQVTSLMCTKCWLDVQMHEILENRIKL